jgi:ABC-type nitrate/sulfonate/bicarbonate transport system substrate-binding protein
MLTAVTSSGTDGRRDAEIVDRHGGKIARFDVPRQLAGTADRQCASGWSPALEQVNFGFSAAGSVATAPLWMAQDSGAFRDTGSMSIGFPCRRSGASGGIGWRSAVRFDVGGRYGACGTARRGSRDGGGAQHYMNQVLAVAPKFSDRKQLKGRRVAIQRLGDLTHIAAREAAKNVGLGESDLQFQQIGGGPARFTALQTGNVQAAVLTPPYSSRARKLGYRIAVNLADLRIPFIGTGVVTTKQIIANRRPLVLNLLKAIAEGIRLQTGARSID